MMAPQERRAIGTDLSMEEKKPIGFADLAQILWRQRWTFMLVAAPLAIAGIVVVKLLPASFEASADIVVGEQVRILEEPDRPPDFTKEVEALADETRFIASREVIGRTADLLSLQEHPEFMPEPDPAWRTAMRAVIQSAMAAVGSAPQSPPGGLDPRDRLINAVAQQLDVESQPLSRVIKITFESQDPGLAAKVANTIAEQYIARQEEREEAKTRDASEWLASRLDRMRGELDEAEKRLAEYRKENSAFGGLEPAVIAEELSDLNERIAVARADRQQIEGRLGHLQSLLSGSSADVAAAVLDSPRFDALRDEIGRLRRTREELSRTFGENHPRMIELDGQLRAAQSELAGEASRQVDALRYQADAAAERLRSLEEDREKLEASAVRRDFATVDLQRLERDAATARELYEQVLQRYKETLDLNEDTNKAYVLNEAVRPLLPSWPKRKVFYLLALVGAAGAGASAAFLRAAVSSGFRSDDEVRAALGLRVHGLVPSADRHYDGPISDIVVVEPNSIYSEAIRMVNSSLLDHGTGAKVCLVTSSVPAEGKTTLCASLARSAALSRKRVLAIDCDLRRASLAPALDETWWQLDGGLCEYLANPQREKLSLLTDNATSLRVLPAGRGSDFSEPLLRAPQLDLIIDAARSRYDLILIDVPPVLPVVDALILARKVDMILMAIQWSKTPGHIAKRALGRLREAAGSTPIGAVLTQVDVRWQRKYDRDYKQIYRHYGNGGYYLPAIEG